MTDKNDRVITEGEIVANQLNVLRQSRFCDQPRNFATYSNGNIAFSWVHDPAVSHDAWNIIKELAEKQILVKKLTSIPDFYDPKATMAAIDAIGAKITSEGLSIPLQLIDTDNLKRCFRGYAKTYPAEVVIGIFSSTPESEALIDSFSMANRVRENVSLDIARDPAALELFKANALEAIADVRQKVEASGLVKKIGADMADTVVQGAIGISLNAR